MKIYREIVKLEKDVPSSAVLRIMQDVGGRHNKSTGLSKFVLAEKGLCWIILSSYIKLERYPGAEEELEVITWRGERKRTLLPRYFVVKDCEGNIVFRGSALWAMLDKESRKMVNPVKYGFEPEWILSGEECRLPKMVKPVETREECRFVVPEEYIDTNKHMNNTHYFDMCERCIKDFSGKKLKEADIDYVSEALSGDELRLAWTELDDKTYVQGENQHIIFRSKLKYQ